MEAYKYLCFIADSNVSLYRAVLFMEAQTKANSMYAHMMKIYLIIHSFTIQLE